MKTLLNAIEEGRLVELPDTDKEKALEYLANILEAIPGIGTGLDITKDIQSREKESNTGLGMGVACPHIRTQQEGDLLCAIGWSPKGIDYGSVDGQKVQLIIMYYIPDSQRNVYLKELSSFAKTVLEMKGVASFEGIADVHGIRSKLLDWVETSQIKILGDTRARMIKLEERQTQTEKVIAEHAKAGFDMDVIPFTLLMTDATRMTALSQDKAFTDLLESTPETASMFTADARFEFKGHKIIILSERTFPMKKSLYECIALRPKQ